MDPYSKDQLLSFYNFHLKQFGDRPEALRWTPQGQLRRYATLAEIAPPTLLRNATVLDYGCGTGDFYRFLKRRGIDVRYTGWDMNPNFIELARKKYPECEFRTVILGEDDAPEAYFDYIFICGVFNYLVPGVQEDLRETMVQLFKRCNKGLALNALSSHAPVKDPELSYTSPEDMVKFSLENLSPYLSLRHDRVQNDFTLYIYTALNDIEFP
jgi:SAM-dependent methyltransferase